MTAQPFDLVEIARPRPAGAPRASARGAAANDQASSGLRRQAANTVDDVSPAQLADSIDRLSAGSVASVRSVQQGALGAWRTWRRIELADGGWIRVIPIDLVSGEFLLQVAGAWADAAECSGMFRLKAGEVTAKLEAHAQAIEAWRAGSATGDIDRVLVQLGLRSTLWAGKFALVDRRRASVSVRVARDMCASVAYDCASPDKLTLQLTAGPLAWVGSDFGRHEIDHILTALKTAVEIRGHLNDLIKREPARGHRLLGSLDLADRRVDARAPVLWVSQSTLDLERPGQVGACVSIPAIELPGVLRGRLKAVPLPLHDLAVAFPGPAWTATLPRENFYSAAVASADQPWVAKVGRAAIERALARTD